MAKAATNELASHQESVYRREYAPSWVDHLTGWVRGLPGQGWCLYLCAGLISLALQLGVAWLDTRSFEWLRPSSIVIILLPFTLLAVIQYLDDEAETALIRFRPALVTSEVEYERIHYRLTTLPAMTVLLATVGGALGGASV